MCGIYGIIGQGIQRDDLAIFKDLMIMNAIRGHHSTGFACGRSVNGSKKKKDEVLVVKKAFDPIWFLENLEKDEEAALGDTFNDFFLGHDRWATTGEVTAAAAHPFEHGNIVGTHNGTFHSLDVKDYHSDSDHFFSRAGELGIKAAVMTLKTQDKYALVWYDKVAGRVNFLRNNDKNFWFCYHQFRNVLYYSSELGALKWALERRGVKPEEYWYPRENIMYAIDPQNLKRRGKPLFVTSEVKPMTFATVPNVQGGQQKSLPFDPTTVSNGPSCDV